MQEEVTQKTIALVIKTSKLNASVLKAAMRMYLNHQKQKSQKTHGKTSVKKLAGEGVGVSSIEVTEGNLITAKKLALELDVSLDELISDEDVNEIQMKYGIWKSERIKSRKELQEFQKKLLNFIEIVGAVFLAITMLLRVQLDMKVPIWCTIIGFCIVISVIMICFVISKKLNK